MNVSEKMTGLMNAVRNFADKSNVKLGIDDATKTVNVVAAGLPFRWKQVTMHGTLLNSITQEGFYYGTGAAFSNKPGTVQNSDNLKIIVLNPSGDDVTQFCLVNGLLWKRDNFSDGWTAWSKLGGVIKPVLSAFLRPLRGGVAYAS